MAGVHGLQHIERFGAAHFADNDAVGVHAKACADQIRNANLPFAFRRAISGLESHQIFDVKELQFCGILYGDDALRGRDEGGERVQKGRFAGIGAAADKDVVAGGNGLFEKGGGLRGQRSVADQAFHGDGLRKFAYGDSGTAEGDRRQHNVDTTAVGKTRIRNGGGDIDAAVYAAHNALNQVLQLFLARKTKVTALYLAAPLDENPVLAVYHDFRDIVSVEEFLEYVQPAKGIEKRAAEGKAFRDREQTLGGKTGERVIDHGKERVVAQIRQGAKGLGQLFPQ